MLTIKIKRLRDDIQLPKQMTNGSSGYDVFAPHEIRLLPNRVELIPCGFSLEIPKGYELQVRPRSGLALKHGITVVNSPGTIDADYRGEVGVLLRSPVGFDIAKGERIAQLVPQIVPSMVFQEVTTTTQTERGVGGFGSTK